MAWLAMAEPAKYNPSASTRGWNNCEASHVIQQSRDRQGAGLVVSFSDEFGDGYQSPLVWRIGEVLDDLPGLVREGLRALLHALDALILVEQRQNPAEGHGIIAAVPENCLHQAAFLRCGALQCVNQRKC